MRGWLVALWVYLAAIFIAAGLWVLRARERNDDIDDDFE